MTTMGLFMTLLCITDAIMEKKKKNRTTNYIVDDKSLAFTKEKAYYLDAIWLPSAFHACVIL